MKIKQLTTINFEFKGDAKVTALVLDDISAFTSRTKEIGQDFGRSWRLTNLTQDMTTAVVESTAPRQRKCVYAVAFDDLVAATDLDRAQTVRKFI
ncbi:hypothetical protein DPF85_05920 [Limosilactobacillus fermentum]|uniref:hypothetical protein n=1 Tax=Limosilactobacillus fermentum TaxID=1613 RepID=UPI000DC0325F|nr:hypothetical protein [Limosilactobacillus fermentum]RAM09877.1 hypothetical protein DPF85_05920 [Limosilactobacillus fermentum]